MKGKVKIISAPKKPQNGTWTDNVCGILQDDSWDSLEELKKHKKEDIELEKRGISD